MDVVGKETLETMAFAKWYNRWLYEMMEYHLGENLLEVGAGTGNFTRLLLKNRKVTSIDIQDNYIKDLKNIRHKDFSSGLGDIEEGAFFFADQKFDSAVALNVIEHIENDNRAIKNIYNLLEDGGKFIMLVPAHQILYSKIDHELGHYRRYSKGEVQNKLKKAGFYTSKVRYLNWWAAIGWFVFLKMSGSRRLPKDKVSIFDKLGKLFLLPEKWISPPFGLSVFAVAEK